MGVAIPPAPIVGRNFSIERTISSSAGCGLTSAPSARTRPASSRS